MKTFISILLICLNSAWIFAQDKVEITGQVKDAQTKDILEFCSVSVYNAKDSLITGSVTDNKGFFTIPVDPGYYKFVISFIGYKSDTTELILVNQNQFVGVFKLEQNTNLLNEVSVNETSRVIEIDRDVQIVTDKMKEGASSTKEVLDKINGVDYDRYNNSIKVDNDSKIIILVDGIEKDQEYVKNLSPDRLKKIEVIRDPGGRYALEGYSAVINILLKKDYKGTEVFISERGMVDSDAKKTSYMPVQNGLSATVNYVYNNVNVYAKYGNNYNHFNFNSTDVKKYNDGLVIDKGPATDDVNTKINQLYVNYTLGIDYYINPKHTISYEGMLMKQPKRNNVAEEIYNVDYLQNDSLLYSYYSKTKVITNNLNSYNYLFYEGKLNENNVINSSFTFSNYNNKNLSEYIEGDLFHRNEEGNDQKNSTRFYVDFTHTFKNKTIFQLGYGNTWEKLSSDFIVESVTNDFVYTDFRHKLYAYYSFSLGKKWSVKLGGAGESSNPNADGIKNSYLIYQPYADLRFAASKIVDLKLKYRSNSIYPNIGQTSPFTSVVDIQSVRTGNPDLAPSVIHKISLQTTILQGLLKIEPYYHFSNNYISQTGTLRPDSIFEYNFSNAGNYKNYGVEASFTVPFGKSIFLQSSFDFFNSSITYTGRTNQINDWSMSNQLIYQNQKHKTVVGLQYQNNLRKFISAQGYDQGDNDFWILFVQQPFLKERLNVMLIYFTPITLGCNFEQGNFIQTDTFSERKMYNIDILKNIFMVELSYRFNKGKSVNKKEKQVEQINERTSKGLF